MTEKPSREKVLLALMNMSNKKYCDCGCVVYRDGLCEECWLETQDAYDTPPEIEEEEDEQSE